MHRVALRRHLFALAVAGILPLALLAGAWLLSLYEEQRELAQRRALEMTRALATALQAELERSVAGLQVLATAASLQAGDVELFDEASRRALEAQPNWRSLVLVDAAGHEIINTAVAGGTALPPVREGDSFAAVLATRRPQIGQLVVGRFGYAFPIRVPVFGAGEVRYVLSAIVQPDAILDIVSRQRVPDDWVISVFDGHGVRVARSRAHERFIGMGAGESLRALMRTGAEGMGVTELMEGAEVFTAYTRLPDNGWSVAIGLPVAALNEVAVRSVGMYGGAVLFSIVFGLLAAFIVARRVNGPMAQLRAAAQALGAGAEPAAPRTEIRELHEVGDAMVAASRARRLIEAEREELLRREQDARGEAEAANRAKDQFLAMLAHELRNPLAALTNASSLLAQERSDARMQARAREVIQRQVAHLARLTDDLLDTARAMLGKIELRPAPVDLARVAGQCLQLLRATGRASGHRITADLQEAWVNGDEMRLEQIAGNLLVNAVKYTPPGGAISVATRREGGEAVLVVTDDGVGLSPELAARAFDLFVQGERRLDRGEGGLGIGLTLVKRLAELHGGVARVRSEGENRGSEFAVRLPAIERPASAVPAPAVPVAAAVSAGPACTILVVEDNDDTRETLQATLQAMGHRVEAAAEGFAGLEKALAMAPDIALLDLGLPGIDGFELARRLRGSLPATRLLALSGYGSAEDRARARESGFDAHLTKPVTAEQLAEALAWTVPVEG